MGHYEFQLDPIVPFLFVASKKEEMLAALRRLKQEAGIKKFILVFPQWNGESKLPTAVHAFEKFGDLIQEVRQHLAEDGIEVGWWCSPSLSVGPQPLNEQEHPFQKIIGIDGAASRTANCPLDKTYIELLSGYVQTVVERGRPPFVFFEDDYEISNHDVVKFGCFCPLHLGRFSQQMGLSKDLSREELEAIFRRGDELSVDYRKAWARLMKDSLVELASEVRAAVDEVAPQTRLALCQPGSCDFDGELTEAVARAFAGSTRPLVRLFGSDYNSDVANNFPGLTFHFLHSKQTLSGDLELIHESDPYPHSRFFFSAAKLRSLITLAMFYGLDGSQTYVTQYTDGPLEEEGYFTMVGQSKAFFSELRRSVADFEMAGPRILYRPFAHAYRPIAGNQGPFIVAPAWASVLGRFGIPYSIKSEEGPVMVCGEEILDLSKDELMELFKGGVFLDGLAAFYLCKNGYGDLIGAEVTNLESTLSDSIGYERLTELTPWREHTAGERMYYTNLTVTVHQESNVFQIVGLNESTQVLSEFVDEFDQVVAPSTVLFTNRLGGRVAINAYNLQANDSASVYNYKRKEQFRGIIEWLGGTNLPVYAAAKHPNVFVSAQEHKESGDKMVAIFNMSLDPMPQVTLMIDVKWMKNYAYRLDNDGVWMSVDINTTEFKVDKYKTVIPHPCLTLHPLILRFTDQQI
ncbi:hypothetical protein [Paenibacillus eucommiae]|uniref:Uncharacterized protein n=1 Tax=Paenibacillus eucommiae TaxID=1355755 RepID=A0ABS4JDV6_9BACL|nr:hypothetical protein [Paenibacillus eucommiae]MBP1996899.1 hypothetical protein [Paenibacillus eucommiae]